MTTDERVMALDCAAHHTLHYGLSGGAHIKRIIETPFARAIAGEIEAKATCSTNMAAIRRSNIALEVKAAVLTRLEEGLTETLRVMRTGHATGIAYAAWCRAAMLRQLYANTPLGYSAMHIMPANEQAQTLRQVAAIARPEEFGALGVDVQLRYLLIQDMLEKHKQQNGNWHPITTVWDEARSEEFDTYTVPCDAAVPKAEATDGEDDEDEDGHGEGQGQTVLEWVTERRARVLHDWHGAPVGTDYSFLMELDMNEQGQYTGKVGIVAEEGAAEEEGDELEQDGIKDGEVADELVIEEEAACELVSGSGSVRKGVGAPPLRKRRCRLLRSRADSSSGSGSAMVELELDAAIDASTIHGSDSSDTGTTSAASAETDSL